jgi:phosphoenolpyruvate synthase/pyruvate phosphate dikinase
MPLPPLRRRNASLTPEEVLADIEAGRPLKEAFASLDLAKCQFREQVDFSNYHGPSIPMEGFGRIAKGHLAFTPEAVKAYETSGTPYITVFPDDDSPFFKGQDSGNHISDAMIFGNLKGGRSMLFTSPDHFGIGIEAAHMTWLRNLSIKTRYAKTPKEQNSISINGVTLHEGDLVTIDGHGQMLYPCGISTKPPPKVIPALDQAASKAVPKFRVLTNANDAMSVNDAVLSSAEGIGLFRSEEVIKRALVLMGNNYVEDADWQKILEANMAGRVYSEPHMKTALEVLFGEGEKSDQLRNNFDISRRLYTQLERPLAFASQERAIPHKIYPLTYRLTDLGAPQLELPDRKIITPINCRRFLAMQADSLFSAYGKNYFSISSTPLSILIPSVRSAEELAAIKEEIDKAARKRGFIDEHGTRSFRFGAMIETRDAAEPKMAAAIAKLCDFASFGTNDLTKDVTGLTRDDLDPQVKAQCQQWMRDHHHEKLGDSPFDVLVPPVVRVMEKAVRAMRLANPNLDIGCCGRQIAGNPHSIEACMKMGLNNISVPPQDVAASRIMAAHFSAKQQLAERSA